MNRFWHSFVPFVASLILLQGLLGHCTSADTVEEESLIFLQKRYGEPFQVQSIDMQRNEGNWGTARLQLKPERHPDLIFQLNYNYSDHRIIFENYLLRLWENEVKEKLKSRFPKLDYASLRLRIARRKSLSANGMDLPVDKTLNGLNALSEPTLSVELLDLQEPADPDYASLATMMQYLPTLGFRKVSLRLEYGKGGKEGKLLAQWYGTLKPPGSNQLKALFRGPGEPPLSQIVKEDFDRAMDYLKGGNTNQALQVFESIVRNHDNPYRYNPYVVAQSGYVYEAAFEAGKILKERGERNRARTYFNLIQERLSYEEVPLRYAAYLRYIEKNQE